MIYKDKIYSLLKLDIFFCKHGDADVTLSKTCQYLCYVMCVFSRIG